MKKTKTRFLVKKRRKKSLLEFEKEFNKKKFLKKKKLRRRKTILNFEKVYNYKKPIPFKIRKRLSTPILLNKKRSFQSCKYKINSSFLKKRNISLLLIENKLKNEIRNIKNIDICKEFKNNQFLKIFNKTADSISDNDVIYKNIFDILKSFLNENFFFFCSDESVKENLKLKKKLRNITKRLKQLKKKNGKILKEKEELIEKLKEKDKIKERKISAVETEFSAIKFEKLKNIEKEFLPLSLQKEEEEKMIDQMKQNIFKENNTENTQKHKPFSPSNENYGTGSQFDDEKEYKSQENLTFTENEMINEKYELESPENLPLLEGSRKKYSQPKIPLYLLENERMNGKNDLILVCPKFHKRFTFHVSKSICSSFYKTTLVSPNGELFFQFFIKKRNKIGLCRPLKLMHDNLSSIRLYNLYEEDKEDQNMRYVVYEDDFGFETNFFEIDRKMVKLEEADLKFIINQSMNGINFIHKNGDVHGNINLHSILLGNNYKKVKIDTDLAEINLNKSQKDDIVDFGKCIMKIVLNHYNDIDDSNYSDDLKKIIKSLIVGDKNISNESEQFLNEINSLKNSTIQIIESFFSTLLKIKKRGIDFSKYENMKEKLENLEEISDKFHKLDLIKEILKNLKNIFKNEINQFLENKKEKDFINKKVQKKFSESLLKNKKFIKYKKEFIKKIEIVVDQIIHHNKQMQFEPVSPSTVSLTSSSEWEKLLSFNPNNFSPDIKSLAQNLNIKNSLTVRLSAVEEFEQMNISDILCSEHWNFVLKQMSNSLGDPHQRIVDKIFNLHLNLFKYSPPEQVVTVYLSLVNHLIWLFESNSIQSFAKNINLNDSIFYNTIKKVKLFSYFQEELSKWWIIYHVNEKEFFDKTFYLLSIKIHENFNEDKKIILDFPLIYICFFDPYAKWFLKLIKGSNLRKSLLTKYPEFFRKLSKIIYCSSLKSSNHQKSNRNVKIFYYLLVQSISMIGKFLIFSETNKIFEKEKEEIISKMINHLLNFFYQKSIFLIKKKKYKKILIVFNQIFKEWIIYSSQENLVITTKHFNLFINPLQYILKKGKLHVIKKTFKEKISCLILFSFLKIISKISKNIVYKNLLFQKDLTLSKEIIIIIKFITFVLENEKEIKNKDIIINCLKLCKHLLKTNNFTKAFTKEFNLLQLLKKNIKKYKKYVIKIFKNLMINANGLQLLKNESEIIQLIIKKLFTKKKRKPNIYLISQILLTQTGFQFFQKNNSNIFREWKKTKLYSFEWFPTEEKYYSKLYDKNLFYLITLSIHFFKRENKKIIDEIVEKFIFHNNLTNDELLNYENFRKFGLKLICSSIINVEVFYFLEKNYKLKERLENEKNEFKCLSEFHKNKFLKKIKKIYSEKGIFDEKRKEEQTCDEIEKIIFSENEITVSLAKNFLLNKIKEKKKNVNIFKNLDDKFKMNEHLDLNIGLYEICEKDSFIGIISLIFKENTFSFLKEFIGEIESVYLWKKRGNSIFRNKKSFDSFTIIAQLVELILREEFPTVYSFFYLQEISPSLIIQKWISQFFLNYINLNEIIKIFCLILLKGIDYFVYINVSGLISLRNQNINQIQVKNDLPCFKNWKKCFKKLNEFKLFKYFEIYQKLEKKYKKMCLEKLLL